MLKSVVVLVDAAFYVVVLVNVSVDVNIYDLADVDVVFAAAVVFVDIDSFYIKMESNYQLPANSKPLNDLI